MTRPSELSDDRLFGLLFTEGDALERPVALEIVRRGAPMAGRLGELLKDEALWADASDRAWAVVHATLLLAASKLPGTLEAVLGALERADRYVVDSIADRAPELLAQYGTAALPALLPLAHARGGSPFVRIWITQALGLIALGDAGVRASVARTLREVAQDGENDSDLRSSAGFELLPFANEGDRKLLLGLSDPELLTGDLIERALRGDLSPELPPAEDPLGFYDPRERAARQERWNQEEDGEAGDEEQDLDDVIEADPSIQVLSDLEVDPDLAPPPLRREEAPGRNEPCLCGSGKKYKKCCGR